MKKRDYYSLNPGERVIGTSKVASVLFDRGGFVLTNQRVIQVHRTSFGGVSHVVSFGLENLDSVQNLSHKPLGCAFFALLCASLAFLAYYVKHMEDWLPTTAWALAIAAVLSWFIYLSRRKRTIILSSGRTEIVLDVTPFSVKRIQELVFEIEKAKNMRFAVLARGRTSNQQESTSVPRVKSRSVKTRLSELKSLLDDGLITEEEYQARRKAIINSL
jgi:hypothetical protein